MVPSCSRRQLLFASAGIVGGLSGCSALSGTDSPSGSFRLGSIEVRNLSPASHRVHVFVERDSEVIYWDDVSVNGKQGDTAGGAIIAPESLVRTEGDYVIHARLDEQTRPTTFDTSMEDLTGCHVVMIRIERDETVGFATSEDAYECDSESTVRTDVRVTTSGGQ